jgi:hypothetical protein
MNERISYEGDGLTPNMICALKSSENGSIIGHKATITALKKRGLIKLVSSPSTAPGVPRDTYMRYWTLTPLGEELMRQWNAN